MPVERLQKLLARAGFGSRRSCEQIIEQKRVTVNGRIATLGMGADPDRDEVRVDGERLRLPKSFDYIMFHKPRGVISDEDVTSKTISARQMIPLTGHLYPVGRLDVQSEGLLLFTNDGDLAHKLTHPRYEHPKIYHVWVEGNPTEHTLDRWRKGIPLDGEKTAPAEIEKIGKAREGTLLKISVHEGRKRQIRRVAAALGHPVHRLLRVQIGPLQLGDLPAGAWRRLTDQEVAALKAAVQKPMSRRPRPKPRVEKPLAPRKAGSLPTHPPRRGARRNR